jgi:TPR repeat protein
MIRPLLRRTNKGLATAAFLLVAAVAAQSAHCAIISPVSPSDLTEVRRQAEAGDSQAQDELAEAYYQQFEPTAAVQWFRNAAEQGVANSQWRLSTRARGWPQCSCQSVESRSSMSFMKRLIRLG